MTSFNIHFLRKLVINGPYDYPGALFVSYRSNRESDKMEVVKTSGGGQLAGVVKKFLANHRIRENVSKSLRIGDLVDRHLIDGDIVLFNRQPSLHRVSIQALKVILLTRLVVLTNI